MHDVLISGGGPVGLGLAIELAGRGIDVAVVERSTKPSPIPKGQNLTQRTMEHMQVWGVEEEIRAAKTIPKGVGLGGLTAFGSLLSGYHYDWFKRAAVRPYYYADNERLPQYGTENVLREQARSFSNIDIHYGWKTEEAGQNADSTWITANKGNETIKLTGRYLIGCDGSRSLIRHSANITETYNDHDRLMVLIVFESPEFFKLVEQFEDKQFYNVLHPDLDGYWMFFGMVEWGKSFFFHAPVPAGTNRENFDFKALIHRAVGN
ncbi:MAG: FAD-dependent monooxygenase, partial [Rhizobiaceae bacterium]